MHRERFWSTFILFVPVARDAENWVFSLQWPYNKEALRGRHVAKRGHERQHCTPKLPSCPINYLTILKNSFATNVPQECHRLVQHCFAPHSQILDIYCVSINRPGDLDLLTSNVWWHRPWLQWLVEYTYTSNYCPPQKMTAPNLRSLATCLLRGTL